MAKKFDFDEWTVPRLVRKVAKEHPELKGSQRLHYALHKDPIGKRYTAARNARKRINQRISKINQKGYSTGKKLKPGQVKVVGRVSYGKVLATKDKSGKVRVIAPTESKGIISVYGEYSNGISKNITSKNIGVSGSKWARQFIGKMAIKGAHGKASTGRSSG